MKIRHLRIVNRGLQWLTIPWINILNKIWFTCKRYWKFLLFNKTIIFKKFRWVDLNYKQLNFPAFSLFSFSGWDWFSNEGQGAANIEDGSTKDRIARVVKCAQRNVGKVFSHFLRNPRHCSTSSRCRWRNSGLTSLFEIAWSPHEIVLRKNFNAIWDCETYSIVNSFPK